MAAESVASRTNVEARRRERSRSKSNFIEFNDLCSSTALGWHLVALHLQYSQPCAKPAQPIGSA